MDHANGRFPGRQLDSYPCSNSYPDSRAHPNCYSDSDSDSQRHRCDAYR